MSPVLQGALVLLAFLVSAGLTRALCDPRSRFFVLDHPNARSLHTHPTPRSGGLAIFAAVTLALAVVALSAPAGAALPWIGAGGALIAGVSYLDDRRSLSPLVRLFVHLLAAGLALAGGLAAGRLDLWPGLTGEWPFPLAVLFAAGFLVWLVNLYNFMDGMDGLAALMAIVGFGSYALIAGAAGHQALAVTAGCVAAAAGGFLVFNFPPARIFMGDVGSSLLGWLAAALGLWGVRDGAFPLWVPVLAFSPFIVDATLTLMRRLLRGERVWEAHRSHHYQRLVRMGQGHRGALAWEAALIFACGASAVWGVGQPVRCQQGLLLAWVIAYLAILLSFPALERRARRAGSDPGP